MLLVKHLVIPLMGNAFMAKTLSFLDSLLSKHPGVSSQKIPSYPIVALLEAFQLTWAPCTKGGTMPRISFAWVLSNATGK